MGSLINRRRRPTFRTLLMLGFEVVVLGIAIYLLVDNVFPSSEKSSSTEPTVLQAGVSQGLTRRDFLPTPTPDNTLPPRLVTFPGASMSAPIIPAGRTQGTWETRHLGDNVGWLVGTSWLDGAGGNIVLAGHVESHTGAPGPFAHLFEAEIGDLVILSEGTREQYYTVTAIDYAEPDDVEYVRQDGIHRLTLITCTEWDYEAGMYLGRLVVVAEPTAITAQIKDTQPSGQSSE